MTTNDMFGLTETETRAAIDETRERLDNIPTEPEPDVEPAEPTPTVDVPGGDEPFDDRPFAERLRDETSAVRLRRRYLGLTRALKPEQRRRAAAVFGATPEAVRGRKTLVDHPAIAACHAAVDRAVDYWKSMSVPYPADRGVRLIRRDRIDEFEAGMQRILDDLGSAVAAANEVYAEVLDKARADLDELFDASDYPESLIGGWGFDWEYPSIEPPDYLQELNPALFAAEQARIRARFEEALAATEQSFVEEFGSLVAKITDQLTPSPDGKVKRFHESNVEKLREFFDRFRELNIGSNAELDQLVVAAKDAVAGVTGKGIRKDADERTSVRESLSAVYDRLTSLMVDRPDRRISLDDNADD